MRTEIHDEANTRFSQFCERAYIRRYVIANGWLYTSSKKCHNFLIREKSPKIRLRGLRSLPIASHCHNRREVAKKKKIPPIIFAKCLCPSVTSLNSLINSNKFYIEELYKFSTNSDFCHKYHPNKILYIHILHALLRLVLLFSR